MLAYSRHHPRAGGSWAACAYREGLPGFVVITAILPLRMTLASTRVRSPTISRNGLPTRIVSKRAQAVLSRQEASDIMRLGLDQLVAPPWQSGGRARPLGNPRVGAAEHRDLQALLEDQLCSVRSL